MSLTDLIGTGLTQKERTAVATRVEKGPGSVPFLTTDGAVAAYAASMPLKIASTVEDWGIDVCGRTRWPGTSERRASSPAVPWSPAIYSTFSSPHLNFFYPRCLEGAGSCFASVGDAMFCLFLGLLQASGGRQRVKGESCSFRQARGATGQDCCVQQVWLGNLIVFDRRTRGAEGGPGWLL